MAKIDKFSFGSIVVEGKKYSQDVLILADGTVRKRGRSFLIFGSHNIRKEEIEELAQGEPEAIIVGTGTSARASLTSEVENWAKEKNVSLLVQPSHDAIAKLNSY